MTFIPTLAIHEKVNFYAKSTKITLEKRERIVVDELDVALLVTDLKNFNVLHQEDFIPFYIATLFYFKTLLER
ncbi:hypothetical protein [Gilliamella sp. wkB171]|uniref:hypothetical protein n=1 Tax=Gilliamella sp. wkB171 TaxID=3120258 RepID=UPI000812C1D2|nr:hypothetical protein [Gilliamella apicola]OCL16214.1 hypothetical protein A9G03_11390 [Gilliamella apicola]